ncbi:lipid A phosphoethanolamine transferase, partial [Acinetobacter baumannii]
VKFAGCNNSGHQPSTGHVALLCPCKLKRA